MGTMTTKIPDEVKARVDKHPQVNWSEVMRAAIISKLAEEELKARQRNAGEVARSITLMDSLRRGSTGNSTEDLRRWRDQRR